MGRENEDRRDGNRRGIEEPRDTMDSIRLRSALSDDGYEVCIVVNILPGLDLFVSWIYSYPGYIRILTGLLFSIEPASARAISVNSDQPEVHGISHLGSRPEK